MKSREEMSKEIFDLPYTHDQGKTHVDYLVSKFNKARDEGFSEEEIIDLGKYLLGEIFKRHERLDDFMKGLGKQLTEECPKGGYLVITEPQRPFKLEQRGDDWFAIKLAEIC